jgi:hypothetical protein
LETSPVTDPDQSRKFFFPSVSFVCEIISMRTQIERKPHNQDFVFVFLCRINKL